MFKQRAEKRPARGDIQSIKEKIQWLAYQLWFDKRDTTEGSGWLVDGRLMAQLDELSESQLLRVERLLVNIVKALSNERYMTAGSN